MRSILSRIALAWLVCAGMVVHDLAAPPGAMKETSKLASRSEDVRKALAETKEQLADALELYNETVDPAAKDPAKNYRKLVGLVEGVKKKAAKAHKKVSLMQEQATLIFAGWEVELDTYESDAVRETSSQRLDQAKRHFEDLGAGVGDLSALYQKVMHSLSDQIRLLGRDFSPAAIGSLQDEKVWLNGEVAKLMEQGAALREKILEHETALEGPD